MNQKNEIIKCIESISGKYSAYEVFTDWIRCCALSISNSSDPCHDKVWELREQTYLDTIRKYDMDEVKIFTKMLGMLAETLEEEMSDILGQIYMESGMGSKAAGQFFTPYHISELCASLASPDPDEKGQYIINEPSCGGGGMIIAAAHALKENGVDYQRKMEVVAQDLDWKGVYMCYLQLSLLGIKATVIQGDTLSGTKVAGNDQSVLYTPAKMEALIWQRIQRTM